MYNVSQAVILAGGRGERLRPFTDTLPKPLYPIDGIPFIDRLILQIKSFGINRVVILLGYLADTVIEDLQDGGKYGVEITYDVTPAEYDTGNRLVHAQNILDERFLLMYCDNYCPINFQRLVEDSYKNYATIQLSVYANKDGYTKNNLKLIGENNLVAVYDKSREAEGLAGVDIGYAIIKKEAIAFLPEEGGSFAADVYPKLVEESRLFATVTEHRYYSIGSFQRIELTKEFFRPKKVVFLDRDGTLNVRPPKACYVEKSEDFQWLPGAIEALKLLKDHNVVLILISNQPGIARGNLTVSNLDKIHEKMQQELMVAGAEIDYIYYCPHNWDEGCECRKPKPGMLFQAQHELSLNLTECVLFGDDERDIEAGVAAGCESIMVSESYPLIDAVKDYIKKVETSYL